MLSSASAQLSFESNSEYGKLWDITYDLKTPQKLYGITLSNHIMVTTDNGANWDMLYAFPNSMSRISLLKLLPGGNALTFAVTNNPDLTQNGVYVLDLATNTIRQHFTVPNYSNNPGITAYSIYDSTGSVALISTMYMVGFSPFSKVYYTTTGGNKWRQIYYSSDYKTVQINNSVISPDNPSKLILCRGLGAQDENGGLMISTNGGATWKTQLDSTAWGPVAFNPRNAQEFFVGSSITFGDRPEALYHTLDGGTTFQQVPIKWTDQTLNNVTLIQFDPSGKNIVWMMDENEMLKSTDGGATWISTVFDPRSSVYRTGISFAINPQNSNEFFLVSDAWPQHSTDGGKTMTQLKMPFCITNDLALDKDLYYAIQGGYVNKDLATGKTKDYNILAPDLVNVREYRIMTDSTEKRTFFYRSTDDFLNPAELFYSDDQGATLHPIPTEDYANNVQFMQKDPNHPSRYWIGYTYRFDSYSSSLFTLDLSDTANPVVTPVTFPYGVTRAAYITPDNDVYLTVNNKLYLSEDGGLTWIDKSTGLESLVEGYDVIWEMQANPFNNAEMAITTTQGIFQKAAGSDNWTLTYAATDLRKIAYSNVVDGHLMAASYSSEHSDCRLVFSTDNGTKWSTIKASGIGYLQCISSMEFSFYTDHAEIYFATSDLGVVKYQLNNILHPELLFLTSFDGYRRGPDAQLIWKTNNEEGLNNYQLERSSNNIDFSLINTQPATNREGMFAYIYDDLDFSSVAASYGNVYYRLKILRNDSSFAYSDTVKLSARDMYIFPVPAGNSINLHVEGVTAAAQYRVLLVDLSGRQYSIQRYNIPAGSTTINMPISRLASGMYIMQVEIRPGEIRKFKFIKQ